jgi:hypothetical protein
VKILFLLLQQIPSFISNALFLTKVCIRVYNRQSVYGVLYYKILTDDRKPFSIQSCCTRYAPLSSVNAHLTRCLYNLKTVKKNVLKIVLIIVNINKDENKSLISNKFS